MLCQPWPSSGEFLRWGPVCIDLVDLLFTSWRISLLAERACLKVDSSESGWDLLGSRKDSLSLPCLFFFSVLTLLPAVSAQQRLAPYHSSSKSLLCPLYPVYSFVSISQLLLCSSCTSRRSVDPFYFPC